MIISLIGDVHGSSDQAMTSFTQNLNSNIAIQLGDFGFIWEDKDFKDNVFLNNFEKQYPNKLILTVLGNHENYPLIMNYPIVTIFGAQAYKIRENIYGILRGEILTLNGKNILCIGGADSVDKELRIENSVNGKTYWWEEEQITEKDISKALNNAKDKKIDFICSHCAPTTVLYKIFSAIPYVFLDSSISTFRLEEVLNQVPFKAWFCGHYHCSETAILNWETEKYFQILNIDEIVELEI